MRACELNGAFACGPVAPAATRRPQPAMCSQQVAAEGASKRVYTCACRCKCMRAGVCVRKHMHLYVNAHLQELRAYVSQDGSRM
jgi:hypothetical protein